MDNGQDYCSMKPSDDELVVIYQEPKETKQLCDCKRDNFSVTCASKDYGNPNIICYLGTILSKSQEEVKPKETKMTRQEAIKKIAGSGYGAVFIDNLEALGLLKFDEDNPGEKVYDLIRAHYALPRSEAHIAASNLINDLRARGYKIVRNT